MTYIDRPRSNAQDPTPEKISGPTKTRRKTPDRFNRHAWRDAVFADPKTPANAKVLAHGIAKFVNSETGEAYPSTLTLAKVCGFSEKTVRNLIPVLQSTGWIEVQFGSKGRGEKHCNRYSINPEKRTPCTVLADRKKRTVKPDFSRLKPDPASEEPLNHKEEEVRFKNRKRAGPQAAPQAALVESQSLPSNGNKSVNDAALNLALQTDIPDTTSAPDGRLCSDRCEEKDRAETLALAAAFYPIGFAVTNGANGTPVDRNGEAATPELPGKAREAVRNVGMGPYVRLSGSGATLPAREISRKNDAYAANGAIDLAGQAARRPDTEPHQKGHDTMSRIAKNEPRPELFAQVKRWYPQEFVGNDDQLSFDAFELCIDHGVEFEELLAGAMNRLADADDGRDVPPLAEFLLSKCWVESIAA